jgi:hypothetical protein
MKRLADLTVEDLTSAPVWRYEGGDGADAVVVAHSRDGLSQMDDEIFLAATDFTLPDSTRHLGFCFPVDDAGLDYLQPAIVTPGGHVQFWFDGTVEAEVLSAQWAALGKRAEEIFPVQFCCRVPVDGREVTGVIPGIETSADIFPARPADLVADSGPEETDEASYESRRPDGAVLSARPSRVRRLFPNRDGVIVTRIAPRRRVEMLVEFDQGGARGTGVTGDVSRNGMFVRSARPPNGGPAVSLTVHLPGGREILMAGRVVRSAAASDPQSPGFALALTDKPVEYDEFFSWLLDLE